jgi:hypothetical protein
MPTEAEIREQLERLKKQAAQDQRDETPPTGQDVVSAPGDPCAAPDAPTQAAEDDEQ